MPILYDFVDPTEVHKKSAPPGGTERQNQRVQRTGWATNRVHLSRAGVRGAEDRRSRGRLYSEKNTHRAMRNGKEVWV
ncbi:hypothetical protein CRI94_15900 [Longibacter salinarum]|uniref:Uncharacterized protein n=1 Tax=Longibacter salinarum TaxID=1850348 RepID=A0A2A8CTQ4_9BACT|nr:hypothetical protein CRI94_15900 [Longibacter salinarum]